MKKPKNPMKSNKFGSFNKRYVKGILSCNIFIMDLETMKRSWSQL